jgi:hypothetical protein
MVMQYQVQKSNALQELQRMELVEEIRKQNLTMLQQQQRENQMALLRRTVQESNMMLEMFQRDEQEAAMPPK